MSSCCPSYKEHRTAEPVPPALIPQMPIIMECLEAIGVDAVGLADYEAEDIIASLVTKVEAADRDRTAATATCSRLIRDRRGHRALPGEDRPARWSTRRRSRRRYSIPGRVVRRLRDPARRSVGRPARGRRASARRRRPTWCGNTDRCAAMIEAGIFRAADAEYLEKASRVVPPVARPEDRGSTRAAEIAIRTSPRRRGAGRTLRGRQLGERLVKAHRS